MRTQASRPSFEVFTSGLRDAQGLPITTSPAATLVLTVQTIFLSERGQSQKLTDATDIITQPPASVQAQG